MTLAQVKKAFLQGNKVEVRKQLKTNGDNAQISYNTAAKAFVIASKNVALLARSVKDIRDFYPEDSRYFIARSIALCWFKKIENMSAIQLQQLKDCLSDKTFVGEFVGKSELQNIVKYHKEAIIFHAAVSNTRKENSYCLPNSHQLLAQFNLDTTPSTSCGFFSDYEELCDKLVEVYQDVSCQPISSSEEGAVLYFVEIQTAKKGQSATEKVISMAKVKSVQY